MDRSSVAEVRRIMKICATCQESKPLDGFGKNRAYKDGLQPGCRECLADYRRRYYVANREAFTERARVTRAANRRFDLKRKGFHDWVDGATQRRSQSFVRDCLWCGGAFETPSHNKLYCGPLCVHRAGLARKDAAKVPCPVCGEPSLTGCATCAREAHPGGYNRSTLARQEDRWDTTMFVYIKLMSTGDQDRPTVPKVGVGTWGRCENGGTLIGAFEAPTILAYYIEQTILGAVGRQPVPSHLWPHQGGRTEVPESFTEAYQLWRLWKLAVASGAALEDVDLVGLPIEEWLVL